MSMHVALARIWCHRKHSPELPGFRNKLRVTFCGGAKHITHKTVDFKLCTCLSALGDSGNGFMFISILFSKKWFLSSSGNPRAGPKQCRQIHFCFRQQGGGSVGDMLGHIFEGVQGARAGLFRAVGMALHPTSPSTSSPREGNTSH